MVLLRQMLFRLRGQVLAYGLGLALWAAIEVFLYPSLESTIGEIDYPEAILEAFGVGGVSIADPRGFLGVEFFSLGPLVMGAFVVFASTAALAGEEASGTMEMLASLPLSRRRMFVQKSIAVLLATLGIAAITSVGWAVSVPFVDLGRELTLMDLVVATFGQVPFAAFMIATGLLFGALAPSRSAAAAWTGALLITTYLVVAIASTVDSVEDLKYVSAYYYSDLSGVLVDGFKVDHQLVLWSATAIVGCLAFVAFEGRELGGERWQFDALLPRGWGAASGRPGVPAGGARPSSGAPVRGATRAVMIVSLLAAVLAGGVAAYQYVSTRPPIVAVSGRVDAPSATILAPTSGVVSVLSVAEGQDVKQGDVLGWMENTLDKTLVVVSAPHTGRITRLDLHQGQFAAAGTPVVVIHELASLHVLLEIDEDDVGRIAVGQPVDLSFTSLGLELTAPVGSIASIPTAGPAARPGQSRKYEVKIPLDARDERILVGLPVDARIHVASARP